MNNETMTMKLHSPFVITSRLLPGLDIRSDGELFELSIEFDGETRDGRVRYRYYIDGPGVEHCGNDLKSGVGGGSLESGMASLLCFLSSAASSYRYRRCDWEQVTEDDNASLFPRNVVEWAYRVEDELTMLQMEIEESETDLIEEPHPFLWPDHVIGKRESRRIRDAHNALFNSHAELIKALENLLETMDWLSRSGNMKSPIEPHPFGLAVIESKQIARAAIAKAKGTM